MGHELRHTAARYELWVDGALVALADAIEDGSVTTIPHVETHPGSRGRGLATELVAGIFAQLRQEHRQVAPTCPFAAQFAASHPEFADIVIRGGHG